MPTMTQITLTIEQDVAAKLTELAGSESQVDEYVTRLILMVHAKKLGRGGVISSEQLVIEIHELLHRQRDCELKILALENFLDKIIADGSSKLRLAPVYALNIPLSKRLKH